MSLTLEPQIVEHGRRRPTSPRSRAGCRITSASSWPPTSWACGIRRSWASGAAVASLARPLSSAPGPRTSPPACWLTPTVRPPRARGCSAPTAGSTTRRPPGCCAMPRTRVTCASSSRPHERLLAHDDRPQEDRIGDDLGEQERGERDPRQRHGQDPDDPRRPPRRRHPPRQHIRRNQGRRHQDCVEQVGVMQALANRVVPEGDCEQHGIELIEVRHNLAVHVRNK